MDQKQIESLLKNDQISVSMKDVIKKENSIFYKILLLLPMKGESRIHLNELANLTNLSVIQVKHLISVMRCCNVHILSDSQGYYISQDAMDVREFLRVWMGRLDNSNRIYTKMSAEDEAKREQIMTGVWYPNYLKTNKCWVLWKLVPRDGRMNKLPFNALSRGMASSTDPTTWNTYLVAQKALNEHSERFQGLGTVMSKDLGIVFIDIDHCVDEKGEFNETALYFLEIFSDQYCECSQSRKGLHFFVKGSIPKSLKNSELGVEMYDDKRFCAMTGNAIYRSEPSEAQERIDQVFEKYKKPEKGKLRTCDISLEPTPNKDYSVLETVVLEKVKKSEKMKDLLNGEWEKYYDSQSEADIALCTSIAYWSNRDGAMIDLIVRNSGLYRDKWDREDYRKRTIELACSISESYAELIERCKDGIANSILQGW